MIYVLYPYANCVRGRGTLISCPSVSASSICPSVHDISVSGSVHDVLLTGVSNKPPSQEVGRAYCFELIHLSIHPFICPSIHLSIRTSHFWASHIFGIMYARILKFDICFAHKKLADFFFSFLSDSPLWSYGPFSDLGILANENLERKHLMNHLS